MLPLFDMLSNSQNGHGMEMLARQFGLSQQQTQAAVEALLPAFSQGLKRNASDPYGVGAFMTAMATGQHAKYFEDAQNAFSPQGVQEGNGVLGHLFGSKDLSRAVASQAAQATGIGQQVLQQMLPVIASMIMGGLFKQSTNQLQPKPGRRLRRRLGQSAPRDHRADDAARRRDGRSPAAAEAGAAAAGRSVRQPVRQGAEGHVRRRRGTATAASSSAGPNRRSPRRIRSATIRSARSSRK